MVARLQQKLVLLMVLLVIASIAVGMKFQSPLTSCALVASILSFHSIVLALEFMCLWSVEPSAERPKPAALFRAWRSEVFASTVTFFWRQPFRSKKWINQTPMTPNGRRGVLLVHGLACNRGFWNPWMKQLARLGYPYYAIECAHAFKSIDLYAEELGCAVAQFTAATGAAPVIVAHSLGGLAVRRWLTLGAARPVHRIITIGTPHGGTWMARFARTGSGRQMELDSDWLVSLADAEAASGYANFTCFYGNCDNVVFPTLRSRLPGAQNRRVPDTAHVALAFSKEVFNETLAWLDQSSQ